MQKTPLAIIGSGPAGYTAGLYAGRANLTPIIFAGEKSGGLLMNTTVIENFPGFPEGVDGPQLMINMRTQAERFGAQVLDQYVTAVDFSARPFKLWTSYPENASGEVLEKGSPEEVQAFVDQVKKMPHDIEADAVVVAVGAESKPLNVSGEKEFLGRGVSTCAVCDAAFYKEKNTIVVGGGDTAMEDSLALTKFAKSVTILVRGEKLRASKVMQDRLLHHPKVKFLYNTSIQKIYGEGSVKGVTLVNNQDQSTQDMLIDGVFVAIGHTPMTKLFKGQLQLDAHDFIVTRQSASESGIQMASAALDEEKKITYPTMTSVPGVFAAGDVVDIRYWQAVTAAGQGCSAAIDAERWLEGR